MSRWYIDSSAALKLVLDEPESEALAQELTNTRPDLVSSSLLLTETRRAAHRHDGLTYKDVTELLETVTLHSLTDRHFEVAGDLEGRHLRSLDAIHIAAAQQIGVDGVVTYDARMATAAREVGLWVITPRTTRHTR